MSFVVEEGPDRAHTCLSHALSGNGPLHAYSPPGDAVPVRVLTGQRPSRGWAGTRRPRGGGPPAQFEVPPMDQVPERAVRNSPSRGARDAAEAAAGTRTC